jgi:hypothetical protein
MYSYRKISMSYSGGCLKESITRILCVQHKGRLKTFTIFHLKSSGIVFSVINSAVFASNILYEITLAYKTKILLIFYTE